MEFVGKDIKQLKGSQLNNLIGSIFAYAGSLFAYSMNGAIAAQCTSLPLVLRAAIASSPCLPMKSSQKLSFILRKNAMIYSEMIAGIANTSPSIPITINAYAENLELKNSTRTIIFASIQCFIMLCIYKLLNTPVYDQLRKNNPRLSHEEAKNLFCKLYSQN